MVARRRSCQTLALALLLGLEANLPREAPARPTLPPVFFACLPGSWTTVSCGASYTQVPNATGKTAVFTVTNGAAYEESYFLQCSLAGVVTSCSVSGNPSPFRVQAGTSAQANVTYATGPNPGTGTVTLTVSSDDAASGDATISVPPPYQVSVTPDGSTVTATPGQSNTQVFAVANTGSSDATFNLTTICTRVASGCQAPQTVPVTHFTSSNVTVTYQAGVSDTGTVKLKASYSTANDSGWVKVTAPAYQVSVTPDGATTANRFPNTGPYTESFTVQNTGLNPDTYTIACSAATPVTCGSTSVGTLPLAPGAFQTVVASYTVGGVGTGSLTLRATSAHTNDPGTYTVPVVPAPGCGATQTQASPCGLSYTRSINLTGQTIVYTVTNNAASSVQYAFSCTSGGVLGPCSVDRTAATIGAHLSIPVTLTYSTTANRGIGSAALRVQDIVLQDDSAYASNTVVVPQVRVKPHAAVAPSRPANASGFSETFLVDNTIGTVNDLYTIACSGSANITCTGVNPTSIAWANGGLTTVVAYYSTVGAGTGTLKLSASSSYTSDTGSFIVPVGFGVAVTPDAGVTPARLANTGGFSVNFMVTNTGTTSDTYTLSCTSSANVTCGTISPSPLPLNGGAQSSVTVNYSTGGVATGTLQLTAVGSNARDDGSYAVPVVASSVAVTPDGQSVGVQATRAVTQTFSVQNASNTSTTYNLSFLCSGTAVTGCSVPSSVTVPGGTSSPVNLSYSSGALGTTGRIRLTATAGASDSGWVNVTVGSMLAPTAVDVTQTTPGTRVEPSICLTVAAGPGAAYQCGDLRIVHALPTTRTHNKARTPTLLYNSQHAQPRPLVAANVTLGAAAATPDSVVARLMQGPIERGRGRWAGSDWSPGRVSRIVVPDTALAPNQNDTVYTFTLEVTNWYATTPKLATTTGTYMVVNRSGSPFGTGWWLAGLERLYPRVDSMIWVGGDGSARQYTATGIPNVWKARTLDHPDTLKWDGTYYLRMLPHGDTVKFNSQGQHVATVNRLGRQTTFAYDGCNRLTTITLPVPAGGSNRAYSFTYGSPTDCSTKLQWVTAPSVGPVGRFTALALSGGRIAAIRDPDGIGVSFAYGTGPDTNRIVSRTDRRGAVTTYGYDAAKKLAQVSTVADANRPIIATRFRALEGAGLANTGAPSAIDTAVAYSRVDGPRTDVGDTTLFWLTQFLAPYRIRNALGDSTLLFHDDTTWRALVTRVHSPNGRRLRAVYDTRGNVDTLTDSSTARNGQYATTVYEWDPRWDFVTKILAPERDSIVIAYAQSNGNRLWQQDGRGDSTRVTFGYNAAQQLVAITVPRTPAESIGYDASLGDVTVTKTPIGFDTRYILDDIGRITTQFSRLDTLLVNPAPVYQVTTTNYDIVDRDTLQQTVGPQVDPVPAETLFVRKFYNANGQLDTLWRWSGPNGANVGTIRTRWRYDLAGRAVAEIAPDDSSTSPRVDSTFYDAAGNVDSVKTRNRLKITMTYDALSRLVTRSLPPVSYPSRPSNIPYEAAYPAYQIPAETQNYTYDALGHIAIAKNSDAKVKRTYFANGLIETDSLWIQTVARDDSTKHAYGVQYAYDLDGRRLSLTFPQRLSATGLSAMTFGYEPQLGALQSIHDPQGNEYDLAYNARGQLATLTYPAQSQYQERYSYDADGRLLTDTITNPSITYPRLTWSPVRSILYWYDAQDRIKRSVDQNGYQDTLDVWYSGLGHVAKSKRTEHGVELFGTNSFAVRWVAEEGFTFDALGNRYYSQGWDTTTSTANDTSRDNTTHQSTFQAGTGRLIQDHVVGGTNSYTYDSAGNTVFTSNPGGGPRQYPGEERAAYYGADGRLRATSWRWVSNPNPTIIVPKKYVLEEYRYDALGRRVWVWSQKTCVDEIDLRWAEALDCMTSLLRRTIWDGDEELAEIQMPGGTAPDQTAQYENDTLPVHLANFASARSEPLDPNPFFGRVLYTPGRGTDHPIAVTRINYEYQHDDSLQSIPYTLLSPTTTIPFWTQNGDAQVGAYTTGQWRICTPPTQQYGNCVSVVWPYFWTMFDRRKTVYWDNWHGSVLESKRDKSGLDFKRNRYYDPQTGRFTQEDPLGLAGGLNLYGFAAGDPVNYSDPFGLCVPPVTPLCLVAYGILIGSTVFVGTRVAYNAAAGLPLAENAQSDLARGAIAGGGVGVGAAATTTVEATTIATAGRVAGSATGAAGALGSRAEAIANLRNLGPETVGMLREFFKTGELPQGLTPEALQAYRAVAEHAVSAGIDKLGVQAQRIQMIDDALQRMQ